MGDAPIVDVEGIRVRLARRFGPEVAGWCAGLPALADDLAVRWGLRLGQAWPKGGTSVVLPCASRSGEQLVLKLTPDLAIAADEATALDIWTPGRHVVTLHDADLDHGALLLERVLPGARLADEPDQWPLAEVAPILAELWCQPPELGGGHGLPDLRARADFVFEITRRRLDQHPEVAARVPSGLVESSQHRADALAGEGQVRVLHGDLHAGNVLRGGEGHRLVAIDPRPCLGDPAFDAVDWVLADGSSEQAVRHRINSLASQVDGLDPDRAWAWCQATAVVIAVALLIGRSSGSAGEKMLAIARSAA